MSSKEKPVSLCSFRLSGWTAGWRVGSETARVTLALEVTQGSGRTEAGWSPGTWAKNTIPVLGCLDWVFEIREKQASE